MSRTGETLAGQLFPSKKIGHPALLVPDPPLPRLQLGLSRFGPTISEYIYTYSNYFTKSCVRAMHGLLFNLLVTKLFVNFLLCNLD